jgi:hypothetical protein
MVIDEAVCATMLSSTNLLVDVNVKAVLRELRRRCNSVVTYGMNNTLASQEAVRRIDDEVDFCAFVYRVSHLKGTSPKDKAQGNLRRALDF